MISRIFLNHPQSVDESYLEHAAFAGRFSLRLFAGARFPNGRRNIPCLFEKTASRMIADMYAKTHNRGG